MSANEENAVVPGHQAAAFELRGVSQEFGNGPSHTLALDNVSLTVVYGESLGIVGESGAGKSTMLRLLLALNTPSRGQILWRGEDLSARKRGSLRDFRRDTQMVFQDPRSSLNPRLTIGRIVAEPLKSLGIPGRHDERVAEVLHAVGLDPDIVSRYPGQFSGGQRQRIAIARALAPRPNILVADEPVSALDVSVKAQLVDLLAELKERLGLTLILVSHDIAIVSNLCESTAVLHDGRIAEWGPTDRVLTNPQDSYTRELLAAVPTLPEV
ncbi:ABC transporter ATP-binding protein [Flaviflexus equikiangi]|uniref:ABC transporter ATP-binding protein n=1 Tax=Flaviflexus equikiangi TaxID=2758573 RepID=UPI0015F58256|nr:ATP-binding cassette domain-containing protein [Flaviflexus equikiangi]